MASIPAQNTLTCKVMKHGNWLGSANLNETQPEWHPQTNEGVMGELTHYNKTVVCVCALEPITEAYTKTTGCIQWEAMGQSGLSCWALDCSVLSYGFCGPWVARFGAWLSYKDTGGLQEHHVLAAGANTKEEVTTMCACAFTQPVSSHDLKCDTVPQIQTMYASAGVYIYSFILWVLSLLV